MNISGKIGLALATVIITGSGAAMADTSIVATRTSTVDVSPAKEIVVVPAVPADQTVVFEKANKKIKMHNRRFVFNPGNDVALPYIR